MGMEKGDTEAAGEGNSQSEQTKPQPETSCTKKRTRSGETKGAPSRTGHQVCAKGVDEEDDYAAAWDICKPDLHTTE
ncbi:hypothetical protein N7466_006472 [Penicillium verhagenii]|uniref:uncharacterized protein n=1 Tax=Penicillium verhagenii TaxID=1562060 RepID=UPI0025451469|nr:uncharacterized protein N7466_006472 [Penicillium verhagenii]KAJ5930979.1 hypothetical protein N7466_006472 [Penicillium verhagenii]